MSFQAEPLELCVGSKEVTLPLTSEAPKRIASRRPSRPKPAGVVVPVARVKLELMVGNVKSEVTDVGFTLPLCEAVATLPKPTLPVTVMRTGGRK
jgi:hypothetical protein